MVIQESHTDSGYLRAARKAAGRGLHKRHRLGAVLVNRSGQVISHGYNSHKTHPQMGFKTLHAEISALIGCRYKDIQHSSMYVIRLNAKDEPAMSKPCPTCRAILREYGVREVYYTNREGQLEKIKLGG